MLRAVDASGHDETDNAQPRSQHAGICLVPSLETLFRTLRQVNFSRVELAPPSVGRYEQLMHGKSVMVAGDVD